MFGSFGGHQRGHGYRPMWYVPKSKEDAEAFEGAKNEIKSVLLVNKEGVTATRIINFLLDIGVEIPVGKFGLTFNQFLFHCQHFIQVRVFPNRPSPKYIFINSNAVDAEAQHLHELVKGQMADKRKSVLARPTLRNTMLVPPHALLDGPPPHIFDGPPPAVASRGRGGRGVGRVARSRFTPPRLASQAFRSEGFRAPTAPASFSTAMAMTPSSNPVAGRPPPSSPSSSDSDGDFGTIAVQRNLPRAFSHMHPTYIVPTPPKAQEPPQMNVATAKLPPRPSSPPGVLRNPEPPTIAKVTVAPPPPTIRETLSVTPLPSATSYQVNVPEGFVHPLKAFSLEDVKRQLTEQNIAQTPLLNGSSSLIKVTVTGFEDGNPGHFYIKLKELFGQVTRIENMMKTFYKVNKDLITFKKEDILLHGFYGGYDKVRGTWHRIQVLRVKDEVEEGSGPLSVFLIDHGKVLDMNCADLKYLKKFHCAGLVRCAYEAAFAFLPHEPRMHKLAATLFMRRSTGRDFLCFLRDIEVRDEVPHLMVRLTMNLDKVGEPEALEPAGIDPTGFVF